MEGSIKLDSLQIKVDDPIKEDLPNSLKMDDQKYKNGQPGITIRPFPDLHSSRLEISSIEHEILFNVETLTGTERN